MTSCSAPESSHCVLDPGRMPEGWRPSGTVQQALVAEAWSATESGEAAFSVRRGIEEMVDHTVARVLGLFDIHVPGPEWLGTQAP